MTARPGTITGAAAITLRAGVCVLLCLALAACGDQATTPEPTTTPQVPVSPSTGRSTTDQTTTGRSATEANPAGDIPDNQVFVPYTPAGARFTVSVPEGWSRATKGHATVFTDKLNSVLIGYVPRATAPTTTTVRTEELPTVRSATAGFALDRITTVRRTAGSAVLVTYRATSQSDPVTGRSTVDAVERYVFWHGGTEVVLTLSGPKGADNVDPWRTITDSVRWS